MASAASTGAGGAHIHARELQKRDRVGAAAAGKEALVVRNGRLALAQDAISQSDRGGEAGGVLEHIVIVIEVRDARPLERDLRVADHVGAEVEAVEREVFFVQRVSGQCLAALCHASQLALELGKHRLTVDRAL